MPAPPADAGRGRLGRLPRVVVSLLIAVLIVSGLGTALTAAAKKPSDPKPNGDGVACLGVEIDGDAPPEVRPQLEKSLASGLGAAGQTVRRRADVEAALEKTPEIRGCTTTACLERLAELVGTRRFARARVEVHGTAYAIEVSLLGAEADDGVIARSTRACAVCTLAEANDLLAAAAAELLAPATVTLRVETEPAGCPVELDGAPLGIAPIETAHAPGEVKLVARCPGLAPIEEAVQLRPSAAPRLVRLGGAAVTPGATPTNASEPSPSSPRASRRFGAWKWAAAGGAALLVGVGVTHLVMDGSGTACADGEPCRELYDTGTTGLAFTAAGVGLGALATWMFLADGPTTATVHADGQSAAASVRVTF